MFSWCEYSVENGNGRFSRLIADRFLAAFKCPYPMWPNHLHEEGIVRKDYIQTLKDADLGNYEPLVHLMKKLGARDPTIEEFLENDFYRSYFVENRAVVMTNALLRTSNDLNLETNAKN